MNPVYLPFKPLSVNQAWKGRRYKTDAYRLYESTIYYSLPPGLKIPEPPFVLSLWFGFSSPASDLDNPVKLIQDVLAKRYKFNDKLIDELHVYKRKAPKGKEFIRFLLETLGATNGEY